MSHKEDQIACWLDFYHLEEYNKQDVRPEIQTRINKLASELLGWTGLNVREYFHLKYVLNQGFLYIDQNRPHEIQWAENRLERERQSEIDAKKKVNGVDKEKNPTLFLLRGL